jgi:hypothetical protein
MISALPTTWFRAPLRGLLQVEEGGELLASLGKGNREPARVLDAAGERDDLVEPVTLHPDVREDLGHLFGSRCALAGLPAGQHAGVAPELVGNCPELPAAFLPRVPQRLAECAASGGLHVL